MALESLSEDLHTKHMALMETVPERSKWYYEKNRSVISTFSLLREALWKKNGNAASLLTLASFLAPQGLDMNTVTGSGSSPPNGAAFADAQQWQTFLDAVHRLHPSHRILEMSERPILGQIAASDIEKFCCATSRRNSLGMISKLSLHGAVHHWTRECLPETEHREWLMLAILKVCVWIGNQDPTIRKQRCMPHVRFLEETILSNGNEVRVQDCALSNQVKRLVVMSFASFYRHQKYLEEAEILANRAIAYDLESETESWPRSKASLRALHMLGLIKWENGDTRKAREAFETILRELERTSFVDETFSLEVKNQYRRINERTAIDSRNEQYASIAAQTRKSRVQESTASPFESESSIAVQHEMTDEEYSLREKYESFSSDFGEADADTRAAKEELLRLYLRADRLGEALDLMWRHPAYWRQIDWTGIEETIDRLESYKSLGRSIECLKQKLKPNLPICAAYVGVRKVVDFWLSEGLDLSIKDSQGRTALLIATENGDLVLTRTMLENSEINADQPNNDGVTPLFAASGRGHEAIVKLLLDRRDVNVNSHDKYSRTALFWAAWSGHESVVSLLLEDLRLQVNLGDKDGANPLHVASDRGHEAIVRLLLDRRDVNINSRNKFSYTPLSYAALRGHENVVRVLLEHPSIEVNQMENYAGTTLPEHEETGGNAASPLMMAVKNQHEAVVQLLLEHPDIDINQRYDELTAETLAEENGTQKILDLIRLRREKDVRENKERRSGGRKLLRGWRKYGRT